MTDDFTLCKRLYELTGWGDNVPYSDKWYVMDSEVLVVVTYGAGAICPDYSTDYLLDKLPGHIALTSTTWDDIHTEIIKGQELDYQAVACYQSNVKGLLVQKTAPTPKQALLKLAIELAEKGIV